MQIPETMMQNIELTELFQDVADIGNIRLHMQLPSIFVTRVASASIKSQV